MLLGPQGPPWWIFFQSFFKNVLVYPQLTQKYVLWHSKLEKSILGSRELILTSILTNTSYIQRSGYLLGLSAFTHLFHLKLGWLSAKIFAYQRLSKTTMYKHQLISKILNRFFKHESIIEGEGQTLCIYHSIEVRKVLDLSNTIQLNIITQRWRMESMYFIPVLFRGLTEQIAWYLSLSAHSPYWYINYLPGAVAANICPDMQSGQYLSWAARVSHNI